MSIHPDMRRALAFTRELTRRCGARVELLPDGFAVFRPELARVFDLNLVWLDRVGDGETAASLADLAEGVQGGAGLAHRKLLIADEGAIDRLAAGFCELGWEAGPLVYMALRRPPDRPAGESVRELDLTEQRAFAERSLRASPTGQDDATIREICLVKDVVAAAVSTRFIAAPATGEPASACDLYVEDALAQIEDMRTLPAHEGRGLARACTLRAAELAHAAGATFVFLVAEQNDWPKELYRRLGFDPIGRTLEVWRRPPEPTSRRGATVGT
jgi:ribosomal protein S18 acetylase RimI-like enzyme